MPSDRLRKLAPVCLGWVGLVQQATQGAPLWQSARQILEALPPAKRRTCPPPPRSMQLPLGQILLRKDPQEEAALCIPLWGGVGWGQGHPPHWP